MKSLDLLAPEAVAIPGWGTPAAVSALRWCLRRGSRALLLSESTRQDSPRRWTTEQVKRRVLSLFDACVVGGIRHREYVLELGLAKDQVFSSCDVVDNDHFSRGAANAKTEAEKLRATLDLPENYFLACARFVPKKNLAFLICSFGRYTKCSSGSPWNLVLVGDGPLRSQLQQAASDAGVESRVIFRGFQQYEALPAYYGLAGALVLPSTSEPWGLVVNEAMATGLPVLVSTACGCAPDLVKNGVNGYTFDPSDESALADLLAEVSSPRCDRAAFGRASREMIASRTPETFAQAVLQAYHSSLSRPLRKASGIQKLILSWLCRK